MLNLFTLNNYSNASERRKIMISTMDHLEANKIGCFTCSGTCCTKLSNSMLITPLETYDLLISLEITSNYQIQKLKKLLIDNIETYRLNKEINTGKKNQSYFRRTYTCPFFKGSELGCTIKKTHKPYGCLGFNPKVVDDNGSSCTSNQALLEERENIFLDSESKLNEAIKNKLNLNWNKKSIPEALLEFVEKVEMTNE